MCEGKGGKGVVVRGGVERGGVEKVGVGGLRGETRLRLISLILYCYTRVHCVHYGRGVPGFRYTKGSLVSASKTSRGNSRQL